MYTHQRRCLHYGASRRRNFTKLAHMSLADKIELREMCVNDANDRFDGCNFSRIAKRSESGLFVLPLKSPVSIDPKKVSVLARLLRVFIICIPLQGRRICVKNFSTRARSYDIRARERRKADNRRMYNTYGAIYDAANTILCK